MLFPTHSICLTNNSSRKANNRTQQIQPSPYCHTQNSDKATEQSRASQSLSDNWERDWSVLSSKLQPASDFRYQRGSGPEGKGRSSCSSSGGVGALPRKSLVGTGKGCHGEESEGTLYSAVLQSFTEPHNFSCRSQCLACTDRSISFPFQTFLPYRTQEIEPETAQKLQAVAEAVRELPDVQPHLGQMCLALLKFTSIQQPSLCIPAAKVLGST